MSERAQLMLHVQSRVAELQMLRCAARRRPRDQRWSAAIEEVRESIALACRRLQGRERR